MNGGSVKVGSEKGGIVNVGTEKPGFETGGLEDGGLENGGLENGGLENGGRENGGSEKGEFGAGMTGFGTVAGTGGLGDAGTAGTATRTGFGRVGSVAAMGCGKADLVSTGKVSIIEGRLERMRTERKAWACMVERETFALGFAAQGEMGRGFLTSLARSTFQQICSALEAKRHATFLGADLEQRLFGDFSSAP